MLSIYVFDRVLETVFKANTGQSIHAATPLDEKVRTFVSRRNVNLAILALALPFGYGIEALYFMAVWQGLSALFHLTRVIQFWGTKLSAQKDGA